MRFVLGEIMHETNTFSNMATTFESFRQWEWSVGNEILDRNRNTGTYMGGMVDGAEKSGIQLIPTILALACPSGVITGDTYRQLKEALLEGIRNAQGYDAICLALHGAGVAEGCDDLEGDILQSVRGIVGDKVPVGITLDLHANVTQTMVNHVNLILGDNFYPHTDSYDRGMELIERMKQLVEGRIKPCMRLVQLPLMIPTSTTLLSPAKEVNALCRRQEERDSVLDCTFYHGFPYSDIQDAGASILTTTDGDSALAQQVSQDVADQVLEMRGSFFPHHPSPAEGIRRALSSPAHPVVINETSDNPGGGAPGDGTRLLQAMIEADLHDACFAFIYDPAAAEMAHDSGAGTFIDVRLGGHSDVLHGTPLSVHAYVKTLSDGRFINCSPMMQGFKFNLGKSARLIIGGIDVIVCSGRNQVFDDQLFLLHGIDVRQYKIVALKSSHHFRAAYERLSSDIITVDSPGLTTIDFTVFSYKNIRKPLYPFDQG